MSLIGDAGETDASLPPGRFGLLLRAALDLSVEHDPDRILDQVVRSAAAVAGARYAALGVYGRDGTIERFVHHGVTDATVEEIGHYPTGEGLLGALIVSDGPIRLADLTRDRRAYGFPPHHPEMHAFLGVPLRVGDRRYGNLYVTEKLDGTTFDVQDEHLMVTLASFAAAAIEGTRLVSAEWERARALADLAAAGQRIRSRAETLARVIDAQEAERARVARDLHDQIGQALTSVLLGLRLVDGSLSSDQPDLAEVRSRSAEVRSLVADALEEVRRLAFELRPTVLDDIGLVAALQRLADDTTARHDVAVELTFHGLSDDERLPADHETVVYRVVQEALTNVCRHAQATRVAVDVRNRHDQLQASVTDDGIGFALDAVRSGSLGLAGMHERAELVGGNLEIDSASGAGTRVVLKVPGG